MSKLSTDSKHTELTPDEKRERKRKKDREYRARIKAEAASDYKKRLELARIAKKKARIAKKPERPANTKGYPWITVRGSNNEVILHCGSCKTQTSLGRSPATQVDEVLWLFIYDHKKC